MKIRCQVQEIEAEQDRYQSPYGNKFSVMGFAKLKGIPLKLNESAAKGKVATRLCRHQGIEIEKVYDPRFEEVGVYPEEILKQVIG